MSQLTTLARPYAKAAFEVALSSDSLATWSTMLSVLGSVVIVDNVSRYVNSPSLSADQQAQALIDLCGEELNTEGQNLVKILAENKRLPVIPEIARLFEQLKAAQERSIDVEVISAFALTDSAEKALAENLKKRLQREVRINSRVDKDLIGGLVVRAGDLVIDGSVRGKLRKLAEAMNS